MSRAQINAWKQEILDLRSGHEFAFWMGGEWNDDGRTPMDEIRRRLTDLNALIAEHSA